MDSFPETFTPGNIGDFKNKHYKYVLEKVREEIYKFFIEHTDITREFYDFTKFCKRNGLDNEIQNNLINDIVSELKEQGWSIGMVFGGTGMIISSSNDELSKSIWSSNLDFEIKS